MAVYVTGYSDCLTGFLQPLSLPCRCHTGFEKHLARSLSFCIVQLREGEGDAGQDEENPGHVQREPLQETPQLQRGADPQV